MSGLHEIPVALKTIGVVAGVLGAGLFFWLLLRALGRLFDRPRIPMGRATYVVLSLLCLVLLAVAAMPLGIGQLLRDHARIDGLPAQVAEVRCTPAAQGKVHIRFSPKSADATAPVEPIESTAQSCQLSAEVVTLRALPARLGLGTLVRVTQVGEAALPAETPEWARPAPDVTLGFPMALVVRQARRISVQASPRTATVYQVVASPDGVALHAGEATAGRPSGG